jgi:hypothetical protein
MAEWRHEYYDVNIEKLISKGYRLALKKVNNRNIVFAQLIKNGKVIEEKPIVERESGIIYRTFLIPKGYDFYECEKGIGDYSNKVTLKLESYKRKSKAMAKMKKVV